MGKREMVSRETLIRCAYNYIYSRFLHELTKSTEQSEGEKKNGKAE
jgi:hypothetical protein